MDSWKTAEEFPTSPQSPRKYLDWNNAIENRLLPELLKTQTNKKVLKAFF